MEELKAIEKQQEFVEWLKSNKIYDPMVTAGVMWSMQLVWEKAWNTRAETKPDLLKGNPGRGGAEPKQEEYKEHEFCKAVECFHRHICGPDYMKSDAVTTWCPLTSSA